MNANTSIVSNSSGFDPSGCPFFRVVAGYERPEEETKGRKEGGGSVRSKKMKRVPGGRACDVVSMAFVFVTSWREHG